MRGFPRLETDLGGRDDCVFETGLDRGAQGSLPVTVLPDRRGLFKASPAARRDSVRPGDVWGTVFAESLEGDHWGVLYGGCDRKRG